MLCSKLTRAQANKLYEDVLRSGDEAALKRLVLEDLFFLLTIGCKRKDINRDWLYERCREVEAEPNGCLDLWSREHYKSTIITFGKTIQDILKNPDITVGIFSHTRPIAKGFMEQIKREFEDNSFLKKLFPDVLYENPKAESPSWSLDNGVLVKRKSNPKEKTIEAWGLVDGQPTSKHYSLLIYDDVVTLESVTTPEQINKVTNAWAMSLNLGAAGGSVRYIGTRYHFNDTWKAILDRGVAKPRIHTATKDGTLYGEPVFLSREALDTKRRAMGSYVFSSQMLQNPLADTSMGFKKEWLNHYDNFPTKKYFNYYILVDPASAKKKTSDYSVMLVMALGQDNNYYLVDAIRDRMNLTERTKKLFEFVRKYNPIAVGYERYGMQSDIEHIKYVMEQEHFRFRIIELGGAMAKEDRIRRLVPLFETNRIYLPHKILFIDSERKVRDFIKEFIEDEFLAFPVAGHDDMLDAMARIVEEDLGAKFPEMIDNIPAHLVDTNYDKAQTDYELF